MCFKSQLTICSKGQQHADRGRRRRTNSFRGNGENISPFEAERAAFKEKAMNKMEPVLKAAEEAWSRVTPEEQERLLRNLEMNIPGDNVLKNLEFDVVGGLCELQLDVLRNDRSDACLTGLAEVTIQSLLAHLGSVFRLGTIISNDSLVSNGKVNMIFVFNSDSGRRRTWRTSWPPTSSSTRRPWARARPAWTSAAESGTTSCR